MVFFMSLVLVFQVKVGHMEPQRQTVTDRLSDVIHIIHIGGKSGVLTVERGEGRTVEEGFIRFVNGRVVEARVGTQTGLAAFNYLNTWQTCRFSLLSRSTDETPSVHLAQLPAASSAGVPTKNLLAQHYQNNTGMQAIVPVRLQAGQEALQQPGNRGLSRIHRHLLLLIDGHRERTDLARLMGRNLAEVQELLSDLERSGFIQS